MGVNKEFGDWWSVYAQSRLAVNINICEIARDAYRAGREKTLYTMVDKKPTHNTRIKQGAKRPHGYKAAS